LTWGYLFAVWLHLLAAAVWIGGMIFLALVLVPVSREAPHRALAASLFHSTGIRFRIVGWACLALLVATGLVNLAVRGYGWADLTSGRLWQGPFGHVLAVKLAVVVLILALSALHDFWLGPRATRVWRADPSSPAALRLRRQASLFGRVTLLLALLVVALGVLLVRGVPG
jgi:copper resistance protein D